LKPSTLVILFTIFVTAWVSSNISWGKDKWKGIMESDAKGYYAYLPAAFIYNDLNFGFFDSIEKLKYFDEHYYYDYRAYHNGKTIDKYYAGTAILQLPFFLGAHLVTLASSQPADGYSKYYCIGVNLAGIFYLVLGLLFLRRLLRLYAISDWNIAICLAATVFGTNLFYYSAVEPGMSHVYSFALFSAFLFHAKACFDKFSTRKIIWMGMLAGLIVLVRPLNIIIVLTLPFIAGSKEKFIAFFKNSAKELLNLLIAALSFFTIASIQLIIYKLSSGSFFVYSYSGEKFNFADPHFIDILFSYRKGLFLYTPVYLFCLLGLFFLYKKSRWQFWFFTFYFVLLTYVLSSWWSWWYGGSFSLRAYIEFLPLFIICLASLLQEIQGWKKKLAAGVLVILTLICQAQTYQYRYNQITWDGMTKEKYWNVFLRLDKLN
jgi:hypothetical protein